MMKNKNYIMKKDLKVMKNYLKLNLQKEGKFIILLDKKQQKQLKISLLYQME